MSIYQEIILEHYRNPRNWGRIANPTQSTTIDNPLCGDRISLDILEKEGKIADIKFSGEGCAISKASASLLSEYVKGKKITILNNIDKKFMINLIGIEVGINRLKCLLLPRDALEKAIHGRP